jgi:hypothetical protein
MDILTTDVLESCAFSIDPQDASRVMAGWPFQEQQIPKEEHRIHEEPMAMDLGPNFLVAHYYRVEPKEFEHGGSVEMYADKQFKRLLIHLYVE